MPYKDPEKQKQAQRDHYRLNQKIYYSRVKQRRRENKVFVESYKSEIGCSVCGEKDVACLELHHRNPRLKDDKIAQAIAAGWGTSRLKNELKKCDVVCANCHRKIHYSPRKNSYTGVEKNNIKRRRNWLFIKEYKRTHCCEECGEEHPACLDFHHTEEKSKTISRGMCDWGLTRLKEEIKRCSTICSNCHRRKHYHPAKSG